MLNQDRERISTESPIMPAMSSGPVSAENGADKGAVIGKSVVIKGEVSGSESLYIEGKIEGVITLPGNRVTVGRNGQVVASVTAREVTVHGRIVGNVDATERLNVRSEGSLTGDVIAHRIMVEDGAYFKGKVDIRNSAQPAHQPVQKIAPASETHATDVINGNAFHVDRFA
jgi:cytoskeletal protein CcmA (bactofilin family)